MASGQGTRCRPQGQHQLSPMCPDKSVTHVPGLDRDGLEARLGRLPHRPCLRRLQQRVALLGQLERVRRHGSSSAGRRLRCGSGCCHCRIGCGRCARTTRRRARWCAPCRASTSERQCLRACRGRGRARWHSCSGSNRPCGSMCTSTCWVWTARTAGCRGSGSRCSTRSRKGRTPTCNCSCSASARGVRLAP